MISIIAAKVRLFPELANKNAEIFGTFRISIYLCNIITKNNTFMKKLLLTFLVLFFGIIPISAQTLVLHHANGKTTDVELLTMPKVKFENDKVLITSTVLNMEYPKEDVLRFTFKKGTTGINKTTIKANVSQENGQLVFHGISSTEKIAVYNTNGIRVPVQITRHGDSASLPLSSIPSGVYLLNVNGKTSKFTKK